MPKIYIVTSGVMPSKTPPFPLVVDPFMNYHGALDWHTNRVIRLSTQGRGRHSSRELELPSKPDYVNACFGEGDLGMLDEAMRKHLALLLKACRVTPELVKALENSCCLTPETIAASINHLDGSQGLSAVSAAPIAQPSQSETIPINGVRLRIEPVFRDGSCLFECFLRSGAMPNITTIAATREAITDLIIANRAYYQNFMGEEEVLSVTNGILFYEGPERERYETDLATLNSLRLCQDPARLEYSQLSESFRNHLFDLYVDVLKNTSMWGGFIEMDAFAKTYGVKIVVISHGQIHHSVEPDNGYQKTIYLKYQDDHYDYLVAEE